MFIFRLVNRIKLAIFHRKSVNDSIVLCLPECYEYTSNGLYKFWWFAENMQYYGMSLHRYSFSLRNLDTRYLGKKDYFAYFPLTYSFLDYFERVIKSPERSLIRKAIRNGITCRRINYDSHLEDILEINLSKEERGGKSITEDYVKLHRRDAIVMPFNPDVYTYGAFSPDGKLIAYYMFEKVTNFMHVVKGMAHNDYLKLGTMNYLFAYSIGELSSMKISPMIIYGRLLGKHSDGLSRYKYNVGCMEKLVRLKGTKRQFDDLVSFANKYHLHGDTSMNYLLDYVEIDQSLRQVFERSI